MMPGPAGGRRREPVPAGMERCRRPCVFSLQPAESAKPSPACLLTNVAVVLSSHQMWPEESMKSANLAILNPPTHSFSTWLSSTTPLKGGKFYEEQ